MFHLLDICECGLIMRPPLPIGNDSIRKTRYLKVFQLDQPIGGVSANFAPGLATASVSATNKKREATTTMKLINDRRRKAAMVSVIPSCAALLRPAKISSKERNCKGKLEG